MQSHAELLNEGTYEFTFTHEDLNTLNIVIQYLSPMILRGTSIKSIYTKNIITCTGQNEFDRNLINLIAMANLLNTVNSVEHCDELFITLMESNLISILELINHVVIQQLKFGDNMLQLMEAKLDTSALVYLFTKLSAFINTQTDIINNINAYHQAHTQEVLTAEFQRIKDILPTMDHCLETAFTIRDRYQRKITPDAMLQVNTLIDAGKAMVETINQTKQTLTERKIKLGLTSRFKQDNFINQVEKAPNVGNPTPPLKESKISQLESPAVLFKPTTSLRQKGKQQSKMPSLKQ